MTKFFRKIQARWCLGFPINKTAVELAKIPAGRKWSDHSGDLAEYYGCPWSNYSKLHVAASFGFLDLIPGGATAEELASVVGTDNRTPLHIAAQAGTLHQVRGGATVAQLATMRDCNGHTPLFIAAKERHLDQIKDSITLKDLASDGCDVTGWTALHEAAASSAIKQVHFTLEEAVALDVEQTLAPFMPERRECLSWEETCSLDHWIEVIKRRKEEYSQKVENPRFNAVVKYREGIEKQI